MWISAPETRSNQYPDDEIGIDIIYIDYGKPSNDDPLATTPRSANNANRPAQAEVPSRRTNPHAPSTRGEPPT